MRIYYPTNDEKPTPALPKGGSLNEAQYSLTTNRLTSNGRHPPLPWGKATGRRALLGNGAGGASTPPLPWRLHSRVLRIKILIFNSGG